MARRIGQFSIVVVLLLLIAGALDIAFAQFGAPKGAPKAAPPPDGLFGWIIAKQNEFYRQFSGLIRAAKADGSAVWGLLGVSFLYGVFHAAGPGHGKAVISSYVVANEETWKRGVTLSFASALLQAVVAVAVVGVASVLLQATAAAMKSAVDVIEIVSYAFIIAIGVRLLRVKGIALIDAWRGRESGPTTRGIAGVIEALCYVAIIQFVFPNLVAAVKQGAMFATIAYQLVGAACLLLLWPSGRALIAALRAQPAAAATATPQVHAHHDHAHHDHSRHDHDAHDHDDHAHHDHGEASAWGHAHAPEPQELAGPGGWTRGFSAVVAVGLRPCSGAIIVLVFALAQGLFWAGVAATFVMGLGTAMTVAVIATIAVAARSWAGQLAGAQSGYGMLAMRAIEVAAALVIVAFGALLLTGYMVSERIGV